MKFIMENEQKNLLRKDLRQKNATHNSELRKFACCILKML